MLLLSQRAAELSGWLYNDILGNMYSQELSV
jgi:hypothetical protein